MFTPKSEFVHELQSRGFIHQATDLEGLDALAKSEMITGYIGFDGTADSLHVGSLVQIMLLRILQRTGHKPIVLVGGGTTLIGDPSGKDAARQLLEQTSVETNIASLFTCFRNYLDFDDAEHGLVNRAASVNNAWWMENLQAIEFLRDIGKHFSINQMLRLEAVKSRLEREQSLSFLEFSYPIFQAYDFVHLAKKWGCQLQMGGSDQWGNIVNGIDLGQRMGRPRLFGLTAPLITTSDGRKMGKSADGTIWLNKDRLPVFEFWNFWRNTTDDDVVRFLKLFTDLPLSEIDRLGALKGQEINEAKKILATEVTSLAHGKEAAEAAAETGRLTFEERADGGEFRVVEITVPFKAYDMLVLAEIASSKSEARKLIRNGGVTINGNRLSDEEQLFGTGDGRRLHLRIGKKRHIYIQPVSGRGHHISA